MQVRKTSLTKKLSITSIKIESIRKKQSIRLLVDKSIDEKRKFFVKLQDAFVNLIFLIHFNLNRKLYINLNAFKSWEFTIMMYHVEKDSNDDFLKTIVQFFLNKLLNEIEKNYWLIKLKMTKIIWVIKHVRHMIDFIKKSFTIIYIDHFVVVSIFKQITLTIFDTNKLNLRLVRVSQYLFNFNVIIRHKFNKLNVILDALSRLFDKLFTQVNVNDKTNILNVLYEHSIYLSKHEWRCIIIQKLSIIIYHVTLIKMSNEFKQRLKIVYTSNKYWKKMFDILKSKTKTKITMNINIIDLKQSRDIRFKLRDELICYIFDDKKTFMYIN